MELFTSDRSSPTRAVPEVTSESAPELAVTTEPFGSYVPIPGLATGITGPGRWPSDRRAPARPLPRLIRRTLKVGTKDVASPADFLPIAKRASWDPIEEKVIQFLCDSKVLYKLRSAKWREDLHDYMQTMPAAFYAAQATVAACDQVGQFYDSKRVVDSTGHLAQRRATLLAAETRAEFDPGFGLDNPNLPTGYNPSVNKKFEGATLKSDRPAWQSGPNPFLGGGKTTGIQNIHISQQLVTKGLQKENDTKTGQFAVCVSCLRWVDINMMDTDHAQPLTVFKGRLIKLAEAMSGDPTIYDDLHQAASMAGTNPTPVEQYFIVTGVGAKRTFQLNLEGLTAYSHNLDNLMKMCKACNQGAGKHFGGLIEWLIGNPFYGKTLADTFPSGPGTARIVDKNTSGLSPSQAIYGHLTSTYGEAVQLSYPALQFSEYTHKTVTSTTRKQYELIQTPHSRSRDEREAELDDRGRRNDSMVRSTKVMHEHYSKKDRPEIRSGSPERDEKELVEHLGAKDNKRADKRKREDNQYEGFVKLAKTGAPTDTNSISDAKSKAVAELANRDAQQHFDLDERSGITDALAANLSLDQSLATFGRPLGYVQGFDNTLQLRLNAASAGHQDGSNNNNLTLPTNPEMSVAVRLIQDYAAAYNKGKADAVMVT